MKIRKIHAIIVLVGLALGAILLRTLSKPAGAVRSPDEKKTVQDRVEEFGALVHGRLGGHFHEIGVAYPPKKVIFLGLKRERVLEVWVAGASGRFGLLKTYPILGASGLLGPKLAEGDRQVPEGLYKIESLNPNSLYHLALRIGYPNAFDREMGWRDGRADLGCDIMIHGSSASIGCLAMGNEAAEDLFVLAAETGIENIEVILSPVDFRVRELPAAGSHAPEWARELYDKIRMALDKI
jgi:hypothetical protein